MKRYSLDTFNPATCEFGYAEMLENETGEYVKYDDIKHLISNVQITSPNSDYAKCSRKEMDNGKCHAYNSGECMNAFTCG